MPFLISADHPEQLDALREHKIIDAAIANLQDTTKRDTVRWHCCTVVWTMVKTCSKMQLTGLYKLTGILAQVFLDGGGDPHLRAAVLNTMHELLARGEVFVGQFISIRGGMFAGTVMETVRTYEFDELVRPIRDSDCIVKYASYTLIHAVLYADAEQLQLLLDMGVYPLLFKIVALQGEEHKPEEAKIKALSALVMILTKRGADVQGVQVRAERRKFNARASWKMIQDLMDARAPPNSDGEDENSDDEFISPSKRAAAVEPKYAWTEEVRNRASQLLDTARDLELL